MMRTRHSEASSGAGKLGSPSVISKLGGSSRPSLRRVSQTAAMAKAASRRISSPKSCCIRSAAARLPELVLHGWIARPDFLWTGCRSIRLYADELHGDLEEREDGFVELERRLQPQLR